MDANTIPIHKFLPSGVEAVEKGFVSGWASAPIIDNSRDLILGTGIDTSTHEVNPVVLWCHQRNGPVIGRAESASGNYGMIVKEFKSNGLPGLWHTTRFNLNNALGAEIYKSYEDGFLKGWSMGFFLKSPITQVPEEIVKRLGGNRQAKFMPSVRLFEYSAVPIPDNHLALTDARFKLLGVPEAYMPFIEKHTAPQTTFAARYPGVVSARETIDADLSNLPPFTGEVVLKAAKGGGGHWVTIRGQHVFVGAGGTLHPGGPGSPDVSHDDAHKAASEGKATKGKPKGRKLVEGKAHKGAANAANKRGEQAIRQAAEARKAGDHEKASRMRAAAYGHFKAAKHHDDGEHLQAATATKTAHEFESGKRSVTKQFPALDSQSPPTREVQKMSVPAEELVTLTTAETPAPPNPIQELRERVDAIPALIEKAVSEAVGVIIKANHEHAKTIEKSITENIKEAAEVQLKTMSHLAAKK